MPETSSETLSLQERAALVARAGLFDADFYVQNNPDLADEDLSPLAHFCQQGWRELRNPSAAFNLWWYWVRHLDGDARAGNPAVHYALLGHAQGLSVDALHSGFASSADRAAFNLASIALLRDLPADAASYDRAAQSLERIGAWDLAEIAADKAVRAAPDNAGYLYRLGKVLSARQTWWRACDVLATAVGLEPTHCSWFSLLGDACMQMGRFASAADAYRQALRLRPGDAQLSYCLGLALDKNGDASATEYLQQAVRMDAREEVQRFGLGALHQEHGDWEQAAFAFAELASHRGDGEAHYRHGVALEHCYREEEALVAYQQALRVQGRPEWHYRNGFVLERLGRYKAAAEAYARALSASEEPAEEWHYRLGYARYCSGDYQAAGSAWLSARARDVGLPAHRADQTAEVLRCELMGQGGDAEGYFLLGACCEYAQDWRGAAEAYEAALARRESHEPTWYYRLGVARFEAGLLREACEAFAELSLFKRPSLIAADPQDAVQEFIEFNATLALRRRVVMYESDSGLSMSGSPYALFQHLLERPGYADYLHVWAAEQIDRMPQAYRCLPNVIVVQRASSLYRRYLATAEYLINNHCFPTYYLRRDGQQYLNTWPGDLAGRFDTDEREAFLTHGNSARNFLQATHLISADSQASQALLDKHGVTGLFCAQLAETGSPLKDAQSSARVAAFFFEAEQAHRVMQQARPPLLFYVGAFAPNGITASALNLLAALESRGDLLAITVDVSAVESFPARREKLEHLPQQTRVLPRAGSVLLTAEERWLIERLNSRHDMTVLPDWSMLERAYRREFQRLFGDSRFAAVVDFSGYNPFWSSLFALGAGAQRKLIYLHADMPEERRLKYPALMTQFRLYRYFDALVSVSAAQRDEHRMALADPFRIPPDHFQSCDNMIDAESIMRRSEQPLEARLASWFEGRSSFLALGRLSPEKGHAKLISAFALLVADFPAASLVIAGDGPLRSTLEAQIRNLGLGHCILMAGQCSNPFSLMAHAACCVLPSDYEGQPMVLLEAMVLQRPIIATDIEACRAVLADGYGVLAANSEAGLASAMSDFLRHGQAVKRFDVDVYQRRALAGFDRLLERSAAHD